MSRAPPPGGSGRMPFGMGSRQPPQGHPQQGYGSPQGYGQPPQGHGDPRGAPRQPPRSPGYSEKPRGRPVPLQVEKVADKSLQARLIYGNLSAVSPQDFPPNADGSDLYVLLRGGQPAGEFVVTAKPIQGFPPGRISLSDPQRSWAGITMRDQFAGELFDPFTQGGQAYLGSLDLEIGFASATKKTETPYDEDELANSFINTFQNQVLAPGQRILMDVRNIPLMIIVKTVGLTDLSMTSGDTGKNMQRDPHARGILTNQTRISFHRDGKGEFNLKPSMNKANSNAILAPDFKFEDMGIGGLSDEFSVIFRRAFQSRIFPPGLVAKLNLNHVKGMLLYGPPGTGKTLIARQIGNMLNARPPKVINGPEVLNKYVGQSEENIRKLFADAEKEYKEKGDESSLHIIIFDELDAVCKQRGSGAGGGTGVGDSVVNQLLSKLDGVDQLNNILLIGMTNRKDMIDDALLRPGRLEVHVEISLPDENGRLEILNIHTAKMRENKFIDADVDLEELAALTKNFSGAELRGLTGAATSFAMSRHTEVGQLAAVKDDVANMKINRQDFMKALTEVIPAYGVSEADLKQAVRLGIINYSPHVASAIEESSDAVELIRKDPDSFIDSVLFYGPQGSGKTALAAQIALNSDFPFVKIIRPADLDGYSNEISKKEYIHRVFADAHKSPTSLLILDDIESLIEWNPIGPRFSSTILSLLMNKIRSEPPKGHRLLTFVTTSDYSALKLLGVDKKFENKVAVPAVSNLQELGSIFQEMGFSGSEINGALDQIQQRTGSDRVDVGVKTIMNCVRLARQKAAGGADVVEKLADLITRHTY